MKIKTNFLKEKNKQKEPIPEDIYLLIWKIIILNKTISNVSDVNGGC